MKWVEVPGDPVILKVGYTSRTHTLEVVMHPAEDPDESSSGVHRYLGVPPGVYRKLMLADSVVGFFCMHIMFAYAQDDLRSRSNVVGFRVRNAG